MAEKYFSDRPIVDERTKLQQMGVIPTPVAKTEKATIDPYYKKGAVSGKSPAQLEAAAAQAAAKANAAEIAKLTGAKIDPKTGILTAVKAGPTGPSGPTGPTGPQNVPTGTDPALLALLQQLQQQNLASQLAAQAEADRRAAAAQAERQSAYDLLYQQFNQYGLGALVEPLKGYITSGINPSEFTIRLRETDAYKKRFAANAARIAKGLRALSEAEYIGLEDQYQDVMRRYGLPDTYYTRGEMGRQEGFEKFIAGDVSPVELEDRIQTAQRRVLNAAPQIKDALAQYYGNEITNGDILAYVLNPDKAIENIKRKVTAAEIGGAAAISGLGATKGRAEELGAFGVTGEQARTGYQTIADILPSAKKLSDIYAKQGLGAYDQAVAEQEVFGITGAADAAQKRRKLTQLETAQFSGTTGAAGGALGRERAGQF